MRPACLRRLPARRRGAPARRAASHEPGPARSSRPPLLSGPAPGWCPPLWSGPAPASCPRPLRLLARSLSSRPRPFCLATPQLVPAPLTWSRPVPARAPGPAPPAIWPRPFCLAPLTTRAPLIWSRPVPVLPAPPLYLALPSPSVTSPDSRPVDGSSSLPSPRSRPRLRWLSGPTPPTPFAVWRSPSALAGLGVRGWVQGGGQDLRAQETPIFPHSWSRGEKAAGLAAGVDAIPAPHTQQMRSKCTCVSCPGAPHGSTVDGAAPSPEPTDPDPAGKGAVDSGQEARALVMILYPPPPSLTGQKRACWEPNLWNLALVPEESQRSLFSHFQAETQTL